MTIQQTCMFWYSYLRAHSIPGTPVPRMIDSNELPLSVRFPAANNEVAAAPPESNKRIALEAGRENLRLAQLPATIDNSPPCAQLDQSPIDAPSEFFTAFSPRRDRTFSVGAPVQGSCASHAPFLNHFSFSRSSAPLAISAFM